MKMIVAHKDQHEAMHKRTDTADANEDVDDTADTGDALIDHDCHQSTHQRCTTLASRSSRS